MFQAVFPGCCRALLIVLLPLGATAAVAQDFPITIGHAFGHTVIGQRPERVATVAWANQEVPLALGVVPVGMAAATFQQRCAGSCPRQHRAHSRSRSTQAGRTCDRTNAEPPEGPP